MDWFTRRLFISLYKGNFGNLTNFGNFLATLSWIMLLGFAMMVSFRAGLFNIGISAQMVGGGLAGYLFAALVNSPGRIGIIPSILIPVLVGISIALFITFLKNRFNIHEVVSSIMINWSIYWVYRYFLNPSNAPYLYNDSITPKNIYEQNSLRADWLTNIFPDSAINLSIFFVIIIIPVIWFLYKKTTFGIRQDIIGKNKTSAIYVGLNVQREYYKAMALSGALAGLAGASFYLGANQSLTVVGNDLAPEAFSGIAVALIGFSNPIGIVGAAIFVALFENSKIYLSVYANKEIANIIPAIIIWFLAITNYFIIYQPHKEIKRWLSGGEVEFREFEKILDKYENKIKVIEEKLSDTEIEDSKIVKLRERIKHFEEKILKLKSREKLQYENYKNEFKLENENYKILLAMQKDDLNSDKQKDKIAERIKKLKSDLLILENKIEIFKVSQENHLSLRAGGE